MLLAAVFFGIGLWNSLHGTPQITYASFPGEGGEWLKWTQQERQLYVAGFLSGYARGAYDGCETFDMKFSGNYKWNGPDDNPLANCRKATPHFSRPLTFYSEHITLFYSENAQYRKIPAYILMKALPDEKEGTQKDIIDVARLADRTPK